MLLFVRWAAARAARCSWDEESSDMVRRGRFGFADEEPAAGALEDVMYELDGGWLCQMVAGGGEGGRKRRGMSGMEVN